MTKFPLIVFSLIIFLSPIYKVSYHQNGILKSEGWLDDDKKIDYWHFYYSNGNIKSKGHYDNNAKDKYWHYFDLNGNKVEEGRYKNDMKHGWWKIYKQDTLIEVKYNYSIKTGLAIYYVGSNPVKAEYYKKGNKTNEWFNLRDFKREYPLVND
jgi:antitoxin component YwqK of YwqJK toxin-antitoxin module